MNLPESNNQNQVTTVVEVIEATDINSKDQPTIIANEKSETIVQDPEPPTPKRHRASEALSKNNVIYIILQFRTFIFIFHQMLYIMYIL